MTKRRKSKQKKQKPVIQETKKQEVKDSGQTSNNGEEKKESDESKLLTFGKFIIGYVISFALGLLSTFLAVYCFPEWFNKPRVFPETHNISSSDLSVYLQDTVETTPDVLTQHNAVINDEEEIEYSCICGDADKPGYGDIVLRLSNHGTSQAIIKRIEIKLIDYKPLDGIKYSVKKPTKLADPHEDIALYGSIDPLIETAQTWQTMGAENGEMYDVDEPPIDTSITVNELKTYYIHTAFLKYGIYTMNFKIYYTYNGNKAYSIASKPVYILYDHPERLAAHSKEGE